jgi:protocatechuate 3,4-dioxygenase beta subunit
MNPPRDLPHDLGLRSDLTQLLGRRRALLLLGGAGLATLAGCSTTPTPTSTAGTPLTTAGGSAGTAGTNAVGVCTPLPEETAGPFPGDGSNGPNVLNQSGIVRRDIRSSIGSSNTVATGVPLTMKLKVLDTAAGCAPLAGAAVYAWHCDQGGLYSMYSEGATDENYLRGVQAADDDGYVTFTSIFPAAYPGRWPHVHFEVYPTLAAATSSGTTRLVSQLAFPKDVCDAVYGASGYESSVRNMRSLSLATDMVFRDGAALQIPVMSGSNDAGYTAELNMPV